MTGTCGGNEVKYKEMDLLILHILGKGQAPSWFPGAKYGPVILRSSSIFTEVRLNLSVYLSLASISL
jgi:hypothetical protein